MKSITDTNTQFLNILKQRFLGDDCIANEDCFLLSDVKKTPTLVFDFLHTCMFFKKNTNLQHHRIRQNVLIITTFD